MRLLIVNDEIIAARSMQEGIDWERCGIREADTAFSAASAKRKMQEKPYDLVLCDIEMPGENGIELVRWIRSQNYDTEIIFLTCHADFAYAQEAIRLGCRSYILSPAEMRM